MMLLRYLANLTTGRLILWCYLVWYFVVLVRYFDPTPRLWLTSLGLSAIIGYALYLSTTASRAGGAKLDFWTLARLFMMPFCVTATSRSARWPWMATSSPRRSRRALYTCPIPPEPIGPRIS